MWLRVLGRGAYSCGLFRDVDARCRELSWCGRRCCFGAIADGADCAADASSFQYAAFFVDDIFGRVLNVVEGIVTKVLRGEYSFGLFRDADARCRELSWCGGRCCFGAIADGADGAADAGPSRYAAFFVDDILGRVLNVVEGVVKRGLFECFFVWRC